MALAVGQHLDLHVARILQELLHVHHVVAERGLGFRLGGGDRIDQRHPEGVAEFGDWDDFRQAGDVVVEQLRAKLAEGLCLGSPLVRQVQHMTPESNL